MKRARASATLTEKITETQRIVNELARMGVAVGDRTTVNQLYRKICKLQDREPAASTPDSQWLFLRRWMLDCAMRIAAPRTPPVFVPYCPSPQMRDVLERCRTRRQDS